MLVQNVNYNQLKTHDKVHQGFSDAVKEALASEAGEGVMPAQIRLFLSEGSVKVNANIVIPPNINVTSVRSNLILSRSLDETVAARVANVVGIDMVSEGAISVMDTEVDSIRIPSNLAALPQTRMPNEHWAFKFSWWFLTATVIILFFCYFVPMFLRKIWERRGGPKRNTTWYTPVEPELLTHPYEPVLLMPPLSPQTSSWPMVVQTQQAEVWTQSQPGATTDLLGLSPPPPRQFFVRAPSTYAATSHSFSAGVSHPYGGVPASVGGLGTTAVVEQMLQPGAQQRPVPNVVGHLPRAMSAPKDTSMVVSHMLRAPSGEDRSSVVSHMLRPPAGEGTSSVVSHMLRM